MIKRKHILILIAAAAILLASCSNDTEPTGGGQLADGKYPLTFTASVGEMRTRAGGKDAWTGTEKIGVRLGDGAAARYAIGTDMQATPDGTDQTVYWQTAGPTAVAAWYPYEAVTADLTDQTGGYEAIDFLRAETADAVYNRPLLLDFKHRMAKVKCIVKKGPGISDSDVEAAQLTLFGWTHATVEEGIPIGTGNAGGAIKPTADGEALLVAQNMDGRDFIKVTACGRDFCYTPQNGDGSLEAGEAYTYTITLKADGIEVTAATGGAWTPGGEEAVESIVFKTDLSTAKVGDFITSDGKLLEMTEGMTLSEEVKKKIAGVVFWTPAETTTEGRQTPASLESDKVMAKAHPNCTHGLAVSLKDVSSYMKWQSECGDDLKDFHKGGNFNPNSDKYTKEDFVSVAASFAATVTKGESNINLILGYQNTLILRAYNEYCRSTTGKENHVVLPVDALAGFETNNPAPANSTGWFLPSVKELHMLCYKDVDDVYSSKGADTRDIVNKSLTAAGCETFANDWYWSTSEQGDNWTYCVYFYNADVNYNFKYDMCRVRAVCAF